MISYRAALSSVSMHGELPRRCFHDWRVQVALLSSWEQSISAVSMVFSAHAAVLYLA